MGYNVQKRPVRFTKGVVRKGVQKLVPGFNGKAGAGAGWVVTGANDCLARLPASQTSATLVIPLTDVKVGDTLQGVGLVGQVESAGNNVSMTMSVRKSTAAAADFTDAELANDTSGTLTADTLLGTSGTDVSVASLADTLAEGELFYVLITATTAAATDIALAGLLVTFDQG